MNKAEAAEHLGVSYRTLDRYVTKYDLKVEYRQSQAGPQEAHFDDKQIAELKQKLETPTARPSTAIAPVAAGELPALARLADTLTTGDHADLLTIMTRALQQVAQPTQLPPDRKLVLTLEEAARYSGESKEYLRELIDKKKLRAVKRGRWRINRADLEKFFGGAK